GVMFRARDALQAPYDFTQTWISFAIDMLLDILTPMICIQLQMETFLLPARGEEIVHRRRNRMQATDSTWKSSAAPGFSSPSSSFSLPWLIPPEISRRRSKSAITDRFSGGNEAKTAPIDGTAQQRAVRVPVSWWTGCEGGDVSRAATARDRPVGGEGARATHRRGRRPAVGPCTGQLPDRYVPGGTGPYRLVGVFWEASLMELAWAQLQIRVRWAPAVEADLGSAVQPADHWA
ncbi:hypothetical protein GW17_00048757, partial [Ensete ventricosum]